MVFKLSLWIACTVVVGSEPPLKTTRRAPSTYLICQKARENNVLSESQSQMSNVSPLYPSAYSSTSISFLNLGRIVKRLYSYKCRQVGCSFRPLRVAVSPVHSDNYHVKSGMQIKPVFNHEVVTWAKQPDPVSTTALALFCCIPCDRVALFQYLLCFY